MDKIRVLIADDHALVREGIRRILESAEDMEVVGEAADGLEATKKVQQIAPEVVLMNIAMPGLGGLEATTEIHKTSPESKVLILTQYDNKEYLRRFFKAGASGYILKKAAGTDLLSAIRAVHRGGTFLDPSLANLVVEDYLKQPEEAEYEKLSDREKEVLKLIAEGYTSKQIADLLTISVKTVMAHRTNIMEKLGIRNRSELIRYAISKGLIAVDFSG